MKSSAKKIELASVDDLFSTEESRQDEQLEKIQEIPLSELHPFKDHPFKVKDDDAMIETADSIKKYGVLVPAIARPLPDGGYELVAGHRRRRASELAGKETMPVIVRDLDDDAATIIMVDSNLQRENLLPSERAFAYKMKLEAIKHQGARTDLTSVQVEQKLSARDQVAKEAGERSGIQVMRYVRLTELIPELLDMVDEKKIAFNPAYELSFLKPDEQHMPEDAERKGLGTPATRAGILEKLVSAGFLERKKSRKTVQLLPSHDAVSLITVLPEQLQSPLLTAEWEYRLGEIERGQLAPEEFLDGISTMLKDLVGTYQVIKGTEYLFTPPREVVGKCPRCGGEVAELQKGFFCQNDSCKFAIWKNNKWWAAKKKQPTKAVVSALLNDGRVRVTGLYSEKTGKTYDATVVLEDDGQYANFKLEFDQRKGGSR